MNVRPIGSLGHACLACGGCCVGVRVRVLPEEEAVVRAAAEALGMDGAVEGGRMRMAGGRCVFLDASSRCRLHAHAGPASKPEVCRQYPLVVTQAGPERRAGVDPGCYHAAATVEAAPLAVDGAILRPVPLDAVRERHEAVLGAMLEAPGATTAGVLASIVGDPEAFAMRWFDLVRSAPLAPLLARPDAGDDVRGALTPVLDAVRALPSPPPVVLAPGQDAWALDVARRVLLLRLVPLFPFLPGTVLLTLGGALLAAWADGPAAPFAHSLAAWTRVLRAHPWREALVPGPESMRALVG